MKRILLSLLLLGGLSACQPKKDSVRAPFQNNQNLNAFGNAGLGLTNQCTQGMSNIGAIYDGGQALSLGVGGTFEDRMKALLSATTSPDQVGTIGSGLNDTTGVRFAGTMFLDQSGNVVSAKSKMTISVYDSIWDQNRVSNPSEQPIPLEFDSTKGSQFSGQFNLSTGQGYFSMKDQYGEIRFDGTYNAQTFSGTVSFKNTTNVTGSAPASGTLGQFTINSCGIVQR